MPFTLAHPAIILPLNYINRKYISLTALVAGSVVPDFEYFIRMRDKSAYSHTITGIFWFDLPLGLVLCFMFHNIVRVPLIVNAPPVLKSRFVPYAGFNWNRHFSGHKTVVVICLLAGIGSHLLFDLFTHASADFIKNSAVFDRTGILQNQPVKVYLLTTGLYSLSGMAAVGYAIWQLPFVHKPAYRKEATGFWIVTCILALMVYYIILVMPMRSTLHFQDYFGSAVSAFLIALLTCSAYISVKWKRKKENRML